MSGSCEQLIGVVPLLHPANLAATRSQALLAFRETYNTTWLIKRHGYLTPSRFREKQLQPLAAAA